MTGSTIVTDDQGPLGYRRLVASPAEPFVVRADLAGDTSPASRDRSRMKSLLAFVHLSDLHVTDVQSPARAEFLDRLGDEDSPFAAALGRICTYRPQEALTYQVLEAMARAVRASLEDGGPATGAPFRFAISTGDSTDNSQRNELSAYVALLDGGSEVRPDSGDPARYEGVGSPECYDPRYWHPDGGRDDLPRSRHGFPTVPGLHDSCRRPILASGLGLPWYAVYGNHDCLLVGTQPGDKRLADLAVGADKPMLLAEDLDPVELLAGTETGPSPHAWGMLQGPTRRVTPDPARAIVGPGEWIAAHLNSSGSPPGHGLPPAAAAEGCTHYAFDAGILRLVVLDTVNRDGGWQGCIDEAQFRWLEDELAAGHSRHLAAGGSVISTDNEDRLFVIFAHHSIETLTNPYSSDGSPRHLGNDLVALLARFPNVVCFVNGHTHAHAVKAFPSVRPDGSAGGFWQITTGSHIDWPQQSRLVELALDEASGDLLVVSKVLDHAGPVDPRGGSLEDPLTLASWSRELAANSWQGRAGSSEPCGRGETSDRNCVLIVPAPFPLADCSRQSAAAERVGDS